MLTDSEDIKILRDKPTPVLVNTKLGSTELLRIIDVSVKILDTYFLNVVF